MNFVIVESRFAGKSDHERLLHKAYARAAMLDCLKRGEAPFASHLLYTQVLDDSVPMEREWGIAAGLELAKRADLTAVYDDLGISNGMQRGIDAAVVAKRPFLYRRLRGVWSRPQTITAAQLERLVR